MSNNIIEHQNYSSIADLIAKKRDGNELEPDEIKQFIIGLSNGDVQDCHVGAMLMAIFIRGTEKKKKLIKLIKIFRYDRTRNLFNDNEHAR
jgi:thymidine phosphorylase